MEGHKPSMQHLHRLNPVMKDMKERGNQVIGCQNCILYLRQKVGESIPVRTKEGRNDYGDE